REAVLEELLEAAPDRRPPHGDEVAGVDVGPARLDPGGEQLRDLVAHVDHERAVVLVLDLTTGLCRRLLDDDAPGRHLRRRREAREPAVAEPPHPPQLALGPTAQPHVGRLLPRLGPHRQAPVREARAVVVDMVLDPQPAHEGERLVEPRRPLLPGDAERLLLGGVGDAEPERGQRATARQAVEARPLPGDPRPGAVPPDPPTRAELEAAAASRRIREADHGIGRVAREAFREPERVEAPTFEAVDELAEASVVAQALHAEPVPDTDLHGHPTPRSVVTKIRSW